jgi:leader peptidase (prepilin peptidase) / N-methyltransferase
MIAVVVLIGWAAGIFVNYVSDIMPQKRSLRRPVCWSCGREQSWIMYLFWPRNCPHCHQPRKWRTWLVEAVIIMFTLWLWVDPTPSLGFIIGLIVLIYFATVIVIDLEHHLILHPTSVVGGILGIGVGIWRHGVLETLLGGLAGLGFMFALYLFGVLFVRFVVRRNRESFSEEALGFGDVILGAILGLFLGWPGVLGGLFLAILLAGLASLVYIVITALFRRYRAFTFIPYGPFLIFSAAALIFLNDTILSLLRR